MIFPKPGSIFYKLLIAYALTIAIIAAGYGAVRIAGDTGESLDIPVENVEVYLRFLADEIGDPPDLRKAAEISGKTGLGIVIAGPNTEWSSSGKAANQKDHYITLNDGQYAFTFILPMDRGPFVILLLTILSVFSFAAILVNYALVKRILKPLGEMDTVAREFGVNRWELRVHAKGNDEFAALGRTLDAMADRIESYVKSTHGLLRAVSHEYRSPLTRMRVALELSNDARIKGIIEEEIKLLERMTGTLLERERLSEGSGSLSLTEVSLRDWLEAICSPYAASGLPVRSSYVGPETTARMDPARMEMALRNLIENSLTHAKGAAVSVTLSAYSAGKQGFSLEVADAGPGMSEGDIGRAGEPFFTSDSSRTGSRAGGGFGLGLSIVKAVAEAHGGTVMIRPVVPHGLSVTLRFQGLAPSLT